MVVCESSEYLSTKHCRQESFFSCPQIQKQALIHNSYVLLKVTLTLIPGLCQRHSWPTLSTSAAVDLQTHMEPL